MNPDDPSESPPEPSLPAEAAGPSKTSTVPPHEPVARPSIWASMLLASLAAAVVAWAAGETRLFQVAPAETDVNLMGQIIRDATAETIMAAELQTATRTFALFGGLLSLAMGVVGGLAVRSRRAAWRAAVLGLVVGGAAGALAPWVMLPLYNRLVEAGMSGLLTSLLVHIGLWTPLGAAGGLAFGLGLGHRDRILAALVGGAAGALLGTIAFEVLGALAFPLAETEQPISVTPTTRLLARLLVAVPVAGTALLVVGGRDPKAVTAAATTGS